MRRQRDLSLLYKIKKRIFYQPDPLGLRLYGRKQSSKVPEFARRYGEEELLDCLEKNEKNGVVYHREGINGDYDDFDDVKALIKFIRTGIRG